MSGLFFNINIILSWQKIEKPMKWKISVLAALKYPKNVWIYDWIEFFLSEVHAVIEFSLIILFNSSCFSIC